MTKTIFEEMGGTYRQVGDYLLPNITVPAEEEIEPIGLWGKRHARHLKEHYKVLYMNLLTSESCIVILQKSISKQRICFFDW